MGVMRRWSIAGKSQSTLSQGGEADGVFETFCLFHVLNLRKALLTCVFKQELVKHTHDPTEKANLKLALDAMKVSQLPLKLACVFVCLEAVGFTLLVCVYVPVNPVNIHACYW